MEHFCEDFVNPWNFHNSETNFQKIQTPSSNQKKKITIKNCKNLSSAKARVLLSNILFRTGPVTKTENIKTDANQNIKTDSIFRVKRY